MRPPIQHCCATGLEPETFSPTERTLMAVGPTLAALLFLTIVIAFHLA